MTNKPKWVRLRHTHRGPDGVVALHGGDVYAVNVWLDSGHPIVDRLDGVPMLLFDNEWEPADAPEGGKASDAMEPSAEDVQTLAWTLKEALPNDVYLRIPSPHFDAMARAVLKEEAVKRYARSVATRAAREALKQVVEAQIVKIDDPESIVGRAVNEAARAS